MEKQNLPSHIVTLEYQDTMANFYLELRYELKYGGTLIVTQSLFSEEDYLQYKTTGKCEPSNQMQDAYPNNIHLPANENLKKVVEEIVEDRRFLYGTGFPVKYGNNFSRDDWDWIIERINAKTTTTFNSRFIDFLKEKNLNPQPHDEEKGQWIAKCPSGAKHPIMISAYFDEFGCGWCKRKGGKQELKEWIHEINMKKYQLNEK